jgi:hypothetical protein
MRLLKQSRERLSLGKSELILVEVRGHEIIVTAPGFYAAYVKPTTQPQLILRERTKTDDFKLLADAWKAANTKARELGWIV